MINIYTDGSSLGNPGPGGYGIILEWKGKAYTKKFSKGFKITTNNRMELLAVIESLEFLKSVLSEFDDKLIIKWPNHKKTARTKDTYQITLDKMSIGALNKLLEHELVKDVYYCPSMPPSGQGYGIDLRYRIFVVYNKKKIK